MIDALETYLLQSGKYTSFFRIYFLIRYYASVSMLMEYYNNWQVLDEGLHPHETFMIFAKTYNWKFPQYSKISNICLYLGRIEAVKHYREEILFVGRLVRIEIYLRKKKHRSFREIITSIISRKEVNHA